MIALLTNTYVTLTVTLMTVLPGGHAAATPTTVPTATPTTTAHPAVPRAEARQLIEAAGHSWTKFLDQTSDRPAYDIGFIDAWLNQAVPAEPTCPAGWLTLSSGRCR